MAASKAGISLAQSAAEAVKGASALMTMLPAGKHAIGVWAEVLPHLTKCALVIDSSTIDMTSARRAHLIAGEQGCLSLDAPVSGGVGGARAGTLTFMVGGAKEAFSRGEQILKHMGTRIVHCGDAGAGQAAKICNNMILGVSMAAVCEAFVLGEKLGLSHQALFDVASNSSGQCWSISTNCPVPGLVPTSPANNSYKRGFAAALMLKDLKLAQDAALQSGAATPLGAEVTQLYTLFNQLGHGGDDFSGLINFLREKQ
jgi:3-hydroxyisobutyrate dehydrogenase